MIYYIEHQSILGQLLLATTGRGLCSLYFEEHKHFKGKTGWQQAHSHSHLIQAVRQLDEYFDGARTAFDLPLDLTGTEFQRAVWRELMAIPFGHTSTYAQQATRIGKPKAVRAVGAAIGRNPVSIIVPCHRVLGTNAGLTGYAGGLDRKRSLLAVEGIQLP